MHQSLLQGWEGTQEVLGSGDLSFDPLCASPAPSPFLSHLQNGWGQRSRKNMF